MSNAVDNLSQLEQRVESLIQQIESARRANAELLEENSRLKDQLADLSASHDAGEASQAEADRLREELETMTGREGLIRERLQGMLQKIDAIEKEIQTTSAAAD